MRAARRQASSSFERRAQSERKSGLFASPAALNAPPDTTLATCVLLLMAIGLVAVYSSGIWRAEATYNSTAHFLIKQSLAGCIGIAAMIIASRLPLGLLERAATPFGVVTLVALIAVFIPGLGIRVKGALRWVTLGPLGRFQPSELARLAVVFLVARYAARHMKEMRSLADIGKALVLPGVFAALILAQPDLDTGLMALLIGGIILYAAGLPGKYLATLGVMGGVGAVVLIFAAQYRMDRLLGFLDPAQDARGKGYQVIQGWTAMGSGGIFGRGLGGSIQKFGYLPEAHTDFIFAVIGEEGGFIAASTVVVLFMLLAWRGYRTAVAQTDPFARFLAVGITSMITLQALLNLMVVTGLAPTTGVPLPLVSYGGTSLFLTCGALGVLLGLSRAIRR